MDMFEHNFSEHNHIFCPNCDSDGNFFHAKKSLHQHQQVHDQEDTVNATL